MKNIMKKNQLMISALAIMVAIAGYLQFAGSEPAKEASTDATGIVQEGMVLDEDYTEDIVSLDTDYITIEENYLDTDMALTDETLEMADYTTPNDGEVPGEAIFTSGTGVEVLYDAKMLKEQTRAKNKETLLEVINSAQLGDDQKQNAVSGIVTMTEIAEKEAAAEILLEAKGFTDAVVSMNSGACDVVVNAIDLSESQRAQIEDIVCRKTGVSPENMIISTVVE